MRPTGLNRSKRQRIVTALDVGTSKICCLITKTWSAPEWLEVAAEDVQFEVLGFGHHRAQGLKAGMVTDLDRAEHCIRFLASAQSGRRVRRFSFRAPFLHLMCTGDRPIRRPVELWTNRVRGQEVPARRLK